MSSRRRHTRCGRDWSSDVCSSDLQRAQAFATRFHMVGAHYGERGVGGGFLGDDGLQKVEDLGQMGRAKVIKMRHQLAHMHYPTLKIRLSRALKAGATWQRIPSRSHSIDLGAAAMGWARHLRRREGR